MNAERRPEVGSAVAGRGELLEALREAAARPSHAAAKAAAVRVLAAQGFRVHRNVSLDDRGDGRRGRVALLGLRGEDRVAIEFNVKRAGNKNASKLRQLDATRVIVLCSEAQTKIPFGIDYIVRRDRVLSSSWTRHGR